MLSIYWSSLAKQDYWNNIDYLLENWSKKDAKNFIFKVETSLNIIKVNPKAFKLTDYKNVRALTIVPQITLYYRVKNNEVELIRFWNNFQNPNKLRV